MAITITRTARRAAFEVYDVITTLAGDSIVTIPHTRRRTPDYVTVVHRESGSQRWVLTSKSAASVVVSRGAVGGSANPTVQVAMFWRERRGD